MKTQAEILAALASKKITIEQAQAALQALDARANPLSCKVSEKGGVSIYGLGRFPVTLYKEQWSRLAGFMPTITAFIKDNDASLKTKAESKATAA